MNALNSELIPKLRQALLSCDEFQNPRLLYAVMGTSVLSPWQNGLPAADAVGARVDLTIHYLSDKHHVNGESALVLFLQVLAERYAPQDERHATLLDLADALRGVKKSATSTAPIIPPEWEMNQRMRNSLLDILRTRVSPTELRTLVYKVLGPGAYDNLPGNTHSERCISFLEEVERHEKGIELLTQLAADRSDVRL